MFRNRRNKPVGSIYGFALTWVILCLIFPMFRVWSLILVILLCLLVAFLISKLTNRKNETKGTDSSVTSEVKNPSAPVASSQEVHKKSYGPEVDSIIDEGNKALSEMGRLYMSIKDPDVRLKINEIMRITDKIVQDATIDASDIPQIKKFMNYYLPTTIKLLNAYDRMSAQGIEGENLDKSMKNINEMLDVAIDAYKKRLDSLFENQALDIETDIDVLNQMLAREGLTGQKDFDVKAEPASDQFK